MSRRRESSSYSAIESVGFLLVQNFALLTYASAVEPLRAANQLAGKTLYRWWNASPDDRPAVASNGTAILPDFKFGSDVKDLDLMIVCAGGNPATYQDRRTFTWLRQTAARGITIGGVSGGPFILAKAGLLAGKRCTAHWEHLPALKEAFPDLHLTQSIFEIDDNRVTCSGGVAGIDMMVALISRDHGRDLGAAVSDWFLHAHMREGTRPQRMDARFRLGVTNSGLLRALNAMETRLETPLSRQDLADVAGTSLRQLERLFHAQLGVGIHEHYLSLRLNRCRQLLRETSLSIMEIALATGFASATQFARAFRKRFSCSAREIRARISAR